MKTVLAIAVLGAEVLVLAGCDREPSKLDQMLEASVAASPTATADKAPPPPRAPTIGVDDGACTIDGDRIDFASADPRGRIAAALAGKKLVVGERLAIDLVRSVKTPNVGHVVAAAKKAKAAGVALRTPKRDGSVGELLVRFDLPAPAPCSAVGLVAKDGSIAVWPLGGGTAKRFVRGYAGPDITLGSEALAAAVKGCESSSFFVGADDTVPWGLAFDLQAAIRDPSDAGARVTAAPVVLTEAPVAGRKVVLE